ncbi:MAG: antibiotic biosynthesis monooxygenase family protein [Thermodesulfobacteriota bacterium]
MERAILKLLVKVPFAKQEETIEVFNTIMGPLRAHPGLLSAGLYTEIDDDGLLLLEEWNARDDLTRHIQSTDFKKILAVMDMALEPPVIQFDTVCSRQGLDLIESLRLKTS